MDEARLKEIERYLRGEHPSLVWRPEELIAALRAAWEERDSALDAFADRTADWNVSLHHVDELQARADRTEAELARLKTPTVTISWKGGQETLPLDRVVFHIEHLQAVREAAVALFVVLWVPGPPLSYDVLLDNLRRALDACA